MDNKLKFLILFLTGAKKNINNNVKQGFMKYNAEIILDLYEINKKILNKVSADFPKLNYQEIKSILRKNSCKDGDENQNFFFKKDEKNFYRLNKTPTSVVRAAAIKTFGNYSVESSNSKKLIKDEIKKRYSLRPADRIDFENHYHKGKEPIDQIITNIVSSNSNNKINKKYFYRIKIDGKKNQYKYFLTNYGIVAYRELIEKEEDIVNNDIAQKQAEKISDKFDRDWNLREKLVAKIDNEEIMPCELNPIHKPILIPDGSPYFEGHHIYPNGKSSKTKNINTEKIGNYIALCPLCHAAIHHGNIEIFKQKIISILKIPRSKIFLTKIFETEDENEICQQLVELYNKKI